MYGWDDQKCGNDELRDQAASNSSVSIVACITGPQRCPAPLLRHSREGGNPERRSAMRPSIPAFAGMTTVWLGGSENGTDDLRDQAASNSSVSMVACITGP